VGDGRFDVLVVGGGPAGLAAAREAVRSGARVILIDDQPELGGSLLSGSTDPALTFPPPNPPQNEKRNPRIGPASTCSRSSMCSASSVSNLMSMYR